MYEVEYIICAKIDGRVIYRSVTEEFSDLEELSEDARAAVAQTLGEEIEGDELRFFTPSSAYGLPFYDRLEDEIE